MFTDFEANLRCTRGQEGLFNLKYLTKKILLSNVSSFCFRLICCLIYLHDEGEQEVTGTLEGFKPSAHSSCVPIPRLGLREPRWPNRKRTGLFCRIFKQQWCWRWWWWRNLRGHQSCLYNKVYYTEVTGQDGYLGRPGDVLTNAEVCLTGVGHAFI